MPLIRPKIHTRRCTRAARLTALAGITVWLLAAGAAPAQAPAANPFAAADQARAEAEQAQAPLLAPATFNDALKDYDAARRDYDRGRSPERISKRLAESERGFVVSREKAGTAARTLEQERASLAAAIAADADRLVPEQMVDARKLLEDAVRRLEKGDVDGARERAERANMALRQAELDAIRQQHLAVARNLIAQAYAAKTDRTAPITTARAEDLLAQADSMLVADRYDTATADEIAWQAEYEARHAIQIGATADRIDADELTPEQLILRWEQALAAVADALDVDTDFSRGSDEAAAAIAAAAAEVPELRERVEQQNLQIRGLEDELHEMDARLGGASADREALMRQVERQARTREQFRQVEEMFAPGEAVVVRDGDNVIVRLVGLDFASNSAEFGESSARLMNKVETAIRIFPQCRLIVEGHTDSVGGVEQNQRLSEQRAQTVMNYLVDTLMIPAFRIRSIGYGDSRPIASNRTRQGRAQNRRIDLIIQPNPDSL